MRFRIFEASPESCFKFAGTVSSRWTEALISETRQNLSHHINRCGVWRYVLEEGSDGPVKCKVPDTRGARDEALVAHTVIVS
jgi:hypothetical protein